MRPLPVIQGPTGDAPLVFERIGIVGLGLIGGSLALACRATWPRSLVIGVDRNEVLEQAVARHAIDVAADDLGMLAEAQLVVLATPVRASLGLLADLDQHVRGEAIVTDVGSTKRACVEAARALPSRLAFVGGHPFAGAARSGIAFSAAEMFTGRPWFLTPGTSSPTAAVEKLSAFVTALGSTPRIMDPAVHDRLMAWLSHLPQVMASTLMHLVGEAVGDDGLSLSGRGLRDTTRLASSAATPWADVCATNADAVGEALDALIGTLTELRHDLEDGQRLTRVFESAQHWRRHLE